jgi:hypothetical protein
MRVTSGEEAVRLLLRSERAYKDVLCHELFCNAPGKAAVFNMDVHVHGWFPRLDPSWEFRGFFSGGKRTALTTYNPWIYVPKMVTEKAKLLEIITQFWDKVEPKVAIADNYSIDFAVDATLNGDAWLVEVNNTLPPMAGSGLFRYADDGDRKLLLEGPFTFRTREAPWAAVDDAATVAVHGDGAADHAGDGPGDSQGRSDGEDGGSSKVVCEIPASKAVKQNEPRKTNKAPQATSETKRRVILMPASPAMLEFVRVAGGRPPDANAPSWLRPASEADDAADDVEGSAPPQITAAVAAADPIETRAECTLL